MKRRLGAASPLWVQSQLFSTQCSVRFSVSRKRSPRVSKAQACAESISSSRNLTHLEFHLLSLLRVDSHDVLVMPECMSAVLLLCGHVPLQSLQHALRLEEEVKERGRSRWDKRRLNFLFMSLPPPLLCAPWWTYLRGIGLHCSQVVLQGQAAVVVENGLHSGEMGLHQPLPLSCNLLLQRLQHGLEVLDVERRGTSEDGATSPRENANYRIKAKADKRLLTSFRACRSDLGRFFDWLSASAHSFMI